MITCGWNRLASPAHGLSTQADIYREGDSRFNSSTPELRSKVLTNCGLELQHMACVEARGLRGRHIAVLLSRCDMQIARHVQNTDTHGAEAQLESIVNRWGKDTLSALCDVHDAAIEGGSVEQVCAHALNLV